MKATLAVLGIGTLTIILVMFVWFNNAIDNAYKDGKRAGYQEFTERMDKIIQHQKQRDGLPPEA